MERAHVPSATELRAVPLFPLPGFTLFPGAMAPLHVFEPRYRQLVNDALADKGLLALPQLKPGFEPSYYERPAIFPICGAGRIIEHSRLPDGRFNILVTGVARIRLVHEPGTPTLYRQARAELLEDSTQHAPQVLIALRDELRTLCKRLERDLPGVAGVQVAFREAQSAGAIADRVAAALVADPTERQALLEELDSGARLERLIAHLYELLRAVSPGKPERELN